MGCDNCCELELYIIVCRIHSMNEIIGPDRSMERNRVFMVYQVQLEAVHDCFDEVIWSGHFCKCVNQLILWCGKDYKGVEAYNLNLSPRVLCELVFTSRGLKRAFRVRTHHKETFG